MLSACATYEYHEARVVPISTPNETQLGSYDDSLLLDVGIHLFDSGVDLVEDASFEYSSVREGEAVWFSQMLRDTLETSRAWGLIRVLPRPLSESDVTVTGKLIESNGESIVVDVAAYDASGQQWFDKRYAFRASQYSYNPEVNLKQDPFQPVFNEIANDLFDVLLTKDKNELLTIRQVAKLKFAAQFLPALTQQYMSDDGEQVVLQRAPANDDPFILKIDAIQQRNQLFLDVIQDYYRTFNANMDDPYREWRSLSYKEVQRERQLRTQARQEKLAGIAMMAAGVVASSGRGSSARIGRYVALTSGGWVFANSYRKQNAASIHAEALRELSVSLEGELAPSIVDLQERTVTLSGTVETQFEEWKGILQQLFDAEFGDDIVPDHHPK